MDGWLVDATSHISSPPIILLPSPPSVSAFRGAKDVFKPLIFKPSSPQLKPPRYIPHSLGLLKQNSTLQDHRKPWPKTTANLHTIINAAATSIQATSSLKTQYLVPRAPLDFLKLHRRRLQVWLDPHPSTHDGFPIPLSIMHCAQATLTALPAQQHPWVLQAGGVSVVLGAARGVRWAACGASWWMRRRHSYPRYTTVIICESFWPQTILWGCGGSGSHGATPCQTQPDGKHLADVRPLSNLASPLNYLFNESSTEGQNKEQERKKVRIQGERLPETLVPACTGPFSMGLMCTHGLLPQLPACFCGASSSAAGLLISWENEREGSGGGPRPHVHSFVCSFNESIGDSRQSCYASQRRQRRLCGLSAEPGAGEDDTPTGVARF
ncbi:hypothetical protein DFH09DRAFT_1281372 [Mycena vulgaris]|nr:hypothetical protein DFH09DRAFT_1281372 [Mycena vulgaris]